MTDDARLPADHAARVMAEIEAVGLAITWQCEQCDGEARFIPAAGPIPFAIEHAHEPDCPEHDDHLPAVEEDGRW